MTITLDISQETQRLCNDLRDWGVADVRPHAREADTVHGPPADYKAVMDKCPANIGGVAVSALKELPEVLRPYYPEPKEKGYLLGSLLMEAHTYGDCWAVAQMAGAGIGEKVVSLLGTPEQKEIWEGHPKGNLRRTAFALTEPGFGSDPASVSTTATRDGDEWVINGAKMYCSLGTSADYTVIFATIDKDLGPAGIRAFVTTHDTPGYIVGKRNESKLGIRSHETSELIFENLRLPADSLLGGEHPGAASGLSGALGTLNTSRPLMGSWALGIASASKDVASDWLRENGDAFTARRRDLIKDEFHRMQGAIDEARVMVLQACALADQGVPNRSEASSSKAFAPTVAEAVCRRVLEILGQAGVTEHLLLEKWFRDVRIMDIFEGSGQIQRLMISRALLGKDAAR